MNLSNNGGKNLSFLCSLVVFYCILNIVPIALIALEAAITRKKVL